MIKIVQNEKTHTRKEKVYQKPARKQEKAGFFVGALNFILNFH